MHRRYYLASLLLMGGLLAGCGGGQTRVVLPQNALAPMATWVAETGLDWVEIEGLPDVTATSVFAESTQAPAEILPLETIEISTPDVVAATLESATVTALSVASPVPLATIPPTATPTNPPASPTLHPTATKSPTPVPSATQSAPTAIPAAATESGDVTVGCAPVGSGSIESQVIALINEIRRDRGLATLSANATLTGSARSHSEDMGCNGFFSHTSPSTGSPFDRLMDAGYSFSWAGENIAAGFAGAGDIVDAWMNSAGHRENILGENYTQIGIGYAYVDGSQYGVYVTAVFASP